jgi:hypothetical protein
MKCKLLIIAVALGVTGAAVAGALYLAYPVQVSRLSHGRKESFGSALRKIFIRAHSAPEQFGRVLCPLHIASLPKLACEQIRFRFLAPIITASLVSIVQTALSIFRFDQVNLYHEISVCLRI